MATVAAQTGWRTVYCGQAERQEARAVTEITLTRGQKTWLDTLAAHGLTLKDAEPAALDAAREASGGIG
jgi:hypothetical protein